MVVKLIVHDVSNPLGCFEAVNLWHVDVHKNNPVELSARLAHFPLHFVDRGETVKDDIDFDREEVLDHHRQHLRVERVVVDYQIISLDELTDEDLMSVSSELRSGLVFLFFIRGVELVMSLAMTQKGYLDYSLIWNDLPCRTSR